MGGNRFYSEALVLLTEAGDLCNGYLEHKFSMTLKVSSNLNGSVILHFGLCPCVISLLSL